MREFKIEKDFMIEGYRCVIVGQNLGHRCGYIAIPKGHEFYGVGYEDIDIDVHGGWTYSENSKWEYPVIANDIWWIGFDCGHYCDGKDLELIKSFGKDSESVKYMLDMESRFPSNEEVRTIEYVENELIDAVKQIKNLK